MFGYDEAVDLGDRTSAEILLIRHGEAISGRRGVVGGHTGCMGLTALGVRQVLNLGDRLAGFDLLPSVIQRSSLQRSSETASLLAMRFGLQLERPSCSLCELHPGPFDGVRFDELPDSWDPYLDRNIPFLPGAETVAGLDLRVRSALLRVLVGRQGARESSTQTGLPFWVTHLGVIRSVLELGDSSTAQSSISQLSPASALLIRLDAGGGEVGVELLSLLLSH